MSAGPIRYSRPIATAMAVLLFSIAAVRVTDTKQAVPSYDDEHIPLTLLNRWWCWGSPLGVDHITAIVSQDLSSPTCLLEGAIAYTLADPVNHPFGGSAASLYRLYAASVDNHMDSGATSEGGYTLDANLSSHVWSTAGPGMVGLNRYYGRTQPDDQPTGLATDVALFDAWNYGVVGGYGFGYPRYGSQHQVYVTVPTAYEGTDPAAVSNQMVIKSNKAAGGIVAQLWYNGFQFLNNFDYGRQLQIGLFKEVAWTPYDNPTEGGDHWSGPIGCPPNGAPPNYLRNCGQSHGSPLLDFVATGTYLRTEVHPLDFIPERISPSWGGIDRPVMWAGKFKKEVTTNFLGDPQIAQWKAFVTIPKTAPAIGFGPIGGHFVKSLSKFWYDDVSIGANPSSPDWTAGLDDFSDRFYTDPVTGPREFVNILPASWCDPLPASDPCKLDPKATEWGMIMLSKADDSRVVGLYYHTGHPGGAKFGAVNVPGSGVDEFAVATNAINVEHIYWGNDVPPGEYPKTVDTGNYFQQPFNIPGRNTWVAYIIVGNSLNEVRTRARTLKAAGY